MVTNVPSRGPFLLAAHTSTALMMTHKSVTLWRRRQRLVVEKGNWLTPTSGKPILVDFDPHQSERSANSVRQHRLLVVVGTLGLGRKALSFYSVVFAFPNEGQGSKKTGGVVEGSITGN